MSEMESMANVSKQIRARIKANPTSWSRRCRAKCLDCVGYQPAEVRKCVAYACFLWPARMGKLNKNDLKRHLAALETTKLI